MEGLIALDEQLFHLLNTEWTHWILDEFSPLWRNKYFWIPFYLLLIAFIVVKLKVQSIYFFIAVALTITISDSLSSKILKKTFERPRPCKTERVAETMILRVGCSASYSFTSSHATNHFALSTFLAFTLGRLFVGISFPLLLWAASISYAQVYVGAHYPLDVLAGGLLGLLIGCLVAFVYNRLYPNIFLKSS